MGILKEIFGFGISEERKRYLAGEEDARDPMEQMYENEVGRLPDDKQDKTDNDGPDWMMNDANCPD